jgi:ABC-type hemin transport system ATPase subunit
MADNPPSVVVIAGPNGAGKSTAAPMLFLGYTGVREFINRMSTHDDPLSKKLEDRPALEAALNQGVEAALRRHVQAGVPVVTWRDGSVVKLSPEVALAEHLYTKRAKQSGTTV